MRENVYKYDKEDVKDVITEGKFKKLVGSTEEETNWFQKGNYSLCLRGVCSEAIE